MSTYVHPFHLGSRRAQGLPRPPSAQRKTPAAGGDRFPAAMAHLSSGCPGRADVFFVEIVFPDGHDGQLSLIVEGRIAMKKNKETNQDPNPKPHRLRLNRETLIRLDDP